jgi:hypothetical protein
VDVDIEGSEVTEFNAVIELAKAGVPVMAVEQQKIGEGASSRNAVFMASTAYQLRKYGGRGDQAVFC